MSNILISAWVTKSHDSGYKFLITHGASPWTAFKTNKGFLAFMERTGLKINKELSRAKRCHKGDVVVVMVCEPRVIEESYFYNLSEIPAGAVPYTELCNGSYVTCYSLSTEEKTTLFLPNPNAKNVYNAMPLHEHIAYSKLNG